MSQITDLIKKIYNHPVTQTASDLGTGSFVGGTLMGSLMTRDKHKKLKELMASKEDQVSAEDYVAEHVPGVTLISSKEDVDKNKHLSAIDKFLLRLSVPEKGKDWQGAFYSPMENNSIIAASEKINKHVLGHEMGHHIDLGGKEPGFLDTGTIGAVLGRELDLERKAWDKSPVEMDERGKEIRDLALGTYESSKKYERLGLGFGLGIVAAKKFGPKILELIRSGNIR